MPIAFSLTQVLEIVNASAVKGSTTAQLHGIAPLEAAGPGEITFLGNSRYRPLVSTSKASVLLLPEDYLGEPQPEQVFLFLPNPSLGLSRASKLFEGALSPKPSPGIHPSAVIAPDAQIASSATVGPLCVLEQGAVIGERCHLEARVFVGSKASLGEDCILMPGVSVGHRCILGKRVRLQPGVVIGGDGFGYEFVNGRHEKVPQIGIVVIEDDVEIGANSAIDRARFNRTVIGQGTKIDNLVQVGHNVIIGRHCILCALVGISGSTTIEDYVVIAGQAGVAGHLTIGKGSKIGGQAAITASLPPGSYVIGTPFLPFQQDRRINVIRKRLPDMYKRLQALEDKLGVQAGPSDSEV